jgi:ribosomal-protein-alanine N-acetyltransferase
MDESSTFCWIETDRVRLLSWKESDAEKFQRISSDPEVMRYINGGRPWSSGELAEFIGRQMRHETSRGFCLWRMVGKTDGETIGLCGLQPLAIGGRDEVEIGWWLAPGCWGKGLATEAAQSVLRYAFECAGLERVIAIAIPENLASRRIMEKIGMRYESETEHKGFRVVLYSASRGSRSAVQ